MLAVLQCVHVGRERGNSKHDSMHLASYKLTSGSCELATDSEQSTNAIVCTNFSIAPANGRDLEPHPYNYSAYSEPHPLN